MPMCSLILKPRTPTQEGKALTAEMMAAQAISRGLSAKEVAKGMASVIGHVQVQDPQTHNAEALERTIRRAEMLYRLTKSSQQ